MADKTTHRIAVTVTFASDSTAAVLGSKILDQALNLPDHVEAVAWHEYDVEEDDEYER